MKKMTAFLTVLLVLVFMCCEKKNLVISLGDNQTVLKSSLAKSNIQSNSYKSVFGPEVFTRLLGTPITAERSFSVENTASNCLFVLNNGDDDEHSKVTSCFVVINNDTIVNPIEIDKEIDVIEKEIPLKNTNQMKVRVLGKPDSFLEITIFEVCTCPGTVTDIDGNVYQTVKIGNQCWMVENLKVTRYRDEYPIPNVTNGDEWRTLTTDAYCNYRNNEYFATTYGRLYNWYAVDNSRGLAPEGWHVPTDEDWQTLIDYLDGKWVAGGKLKEAGTTHWQSPNTGATNETGFTALPGGWRFLDGYFYDMGQIANYWSSTEFNSYNAWCRVLWWNHPYVSRNNRPKSWGFSVRCIKDD